MKRKIPTISPDRIDDTPADASVGGSKTDKRAHAFMKGKEPAQPLTIRLPEPLYQELRTLAFNTNDKLNQIIVRALREHLKHHG